MKNGQKEKKRKEKMDIPPCRVGGAAAGTIAALSSIRRLAFSNLPPRAAYSHTRVEVVHVAYVRSRHI